MSGATQDSAVRRGPIPFARPRDGRWLGGVCLAVARVRHFKITWVRVAFVLAAALGGLGAVVYAACWLIVPSEGERADDAGASRRAVVVAQACAACAGLATLAALGATATVFGFGWAVAVLAGAVLAAVLIGRPRLGPAWALLPVAALTLPSLAVSAEGLRLAPQTANVVVSPHAAPGRAFAGATYRSGIGTLLVDLRRTPLPTSGTIPLRIEAGVRRTIVALPHDRCVHVDVRPHVTLFLGQLGALLTGREDRPFAGVIVFGTSIYDPGTRTTASDGRQGPTLKIEFSSMGGSLYVRDFPNDIAPTRVNWPGFPVAPERRPDTTGMTRRGAAVELRGWRRRLREELASKRVVDALMPGPCAPPEAREATR
jgi:phage shock protein PspC (stress-responsive transcriptional regulator)